jgi:hypothetical protein
MTYYVRVENEERVEIYRWSKSYENINEALNFVIESLDHLRDGEHPVIYKEERIEIDSFSLQIGRAFLKTE